MLLSKDEIGDALVARSIAEAHPRQVCDVVAKVVTTSPAPGHLLALDVTIDDGTGRLLCHFTGRRAIPGVVGGTRLRVTGTVGIYRGRRCLLNPAYELLADDWGNASS